MSRIQQRSWRRSEKGSRCGWVAVEKGPVCSVARSLSSPTEWRPGQGGGGEELRAGRGGTWGRGRWASVIPVDIRLCSVAAGRGK